MKKIDLLTPEEVIKNGLEFDGEVCFSGEYGQQVYTKPMEDGGVAVNGLLYEKYSENQIAYYRYHVNGVPDGEYVTFYRNGNIKSYCVMEKGKILGEHLSWYEDGSKKSVESCKYGISLSFTKWDEQGKIVDSKEEPTESEKKILNKYTMKYSK